MSPNMDPLIIVFHATLFVGSLFGVTSAGMGLLRPPLQESIAGTHSGSEGAQPWACLSSDC